MPEYGLLRSGLGVHSGVFDGLIVLPGLVCVDFYINSDFDRNTAETLCS
jgi:hypothetical protein